MYVCTYDLDLLTNNVFFLFCSSINLAPQKKNTTDTPSIFCFKCTVSSFLLLLFFFFARRHLFFTRTYTNIHKQYYYYFLLCVCVCVRVDSILVETNLTTTQFNPTRDYQTTYLKRGFMF